MSKKMYEAEYRLRELFGPNGTIIQDRVELFKWAGREIESLRLNLAVVTKERDELMKTQAVCECGGLIKDHKVFDGHYPSEMQVECPYRVDAMKARGEGDGT